MKKKILTGICVVVVLATALGASKLKPSLTENPGFSSMNMSTQTTTVCSADNYKPLNTENPGFSS